MRKLALLVCFAAGAAGLATSAQAGEMQAPPAYVTVGKVVEMDDVENKRYTGYVVSSSKVDLVARVSGEMVKMNFQEGDLVHKGQVLYELDPIRYEAEVRNIEARITEYEAKLVYAELSFRRADELHRQNAGTQDTRDARESELKAAKAALLAAEAQLITTKDDLENTKILAPISGKIGVSNFTAGNYLTPDSGVIASIVQLDPLRVSFSIGNRDFLSMFGTEENMKAHARIRLRLADDSIYEHDGVVEFLDNHANERTDAIHVYVSFPNPDHKLVPGSTVTVLLSRSNGDKVPALLSSAVMHDSRAAYVYVVDEDNKVSRRDVVLGQGAGALQLIKEGVEPGELVVVDGNHKTMPGGTIIPDYQDIMSLNAVVDKLAKAM